MIQPALGNQTSHSQHAEKKQFGKNLRAIRKDFGKHGLQVSETLPSNNNSGIDVAPLGGEKAGRIYNPVSEEIGVTGFAISVAVLHMTMAHTWTRKLMLKRGKGNR